MLRINRTHLYLSNVLNTYPNTFINEFNKSINSLRAFYIFDLAYYKAKKWEKPDTILFLEYQKGKELGTFLRFLRKFKGYRDDYSIDLKSRVGVILDIPDEFKKSLVPFLNGEYSKMYTEKELTKIGIYPIKQGTVNTVYLVCTHNPQALDHYKEAVYQVYRSTRTPDVPNEYDIPPRIDMECLNWEENIDLAKKLGLKNWKYDSKTT